MKGGEPWVSQEALVWTRRPIPGLRSVPSELRGARHPRGRSENSQGPCPLHCWGDEGRLWQARVGVGAWEPEPGGQGCFRNCPEKKGPHF